MKPKEILVFGASGQVGRNLIRKLTKNNYKVVAVTRNIHQKGYILKTQANPGYLEIVQLESFNINKIKDLISKCSICINLIGILFEKNKDQFKNIHTYFPKLLSQLSHEYNIDQFIHISSLGIENAIDSKYALSKIEGENEVKNNFNRSLILKPSIVYSVDDNFTTTFMSLLNIVPFFPLYFEGKTKFSPIQVNDLTEIIYVSIERKITAKTVECVGPEQITFKEIILKLLNSIDKKRLLIPVPFIIAKFIASTLGLFPKPIFTNDQLKLLKYDNIVSGKYLTNSDLDIKANRKFDEEIEKYSFNYRSGGQFSKKKIIKK